MAQCDNPLITVSVTVGRYNALRPEKVCPLRPMYDLCPGPGGEVPHQSWRARRRARSVGAAVSVRILEHIAQPGAQAVGFVRGSGGELDERA